MSERQRDLEFEKPIFKENGNVVGLVFKTCCLTMKVL